MIFITAIISLGIGLALGAYFFGVVADREYFGNMKTIKAQAETIAAQAEEIDALNLNNLRLRGQCTELATLAHTADAEAYDVSEDLSEEVSQHAATKRKLSAAKGQITKLKRRLA